MLSISRPPVLTPVRRALVRTRRPNPRAKLHPQTFQTPQPTDLAESKQTEANMPQCQSNKSAKGLCSSEHRIPQPSAALDACGSGHPMHSYKVQGWGIRTGQLCTPWPGADLHQTGHHGRRGCFELRALPVGSLVVPFWDYLIGS